jgi:hypothetical protein
VLTSQGRPVAEAVRTIYMAVPGVLAMYFIMYPAHLNALLHWIMR